MPPTNDLVRTMVLLGALIGGHLLWVKVSPWPWYMEPLSLVVFAPFVVWYRLRYRARWPIHGRPFWTLQMPRGYEFWIAILVGALGAILLIILEGVAWSGWD